MCQIAFLLGGFLGKDVAFESVFSLNLTCTGESEALLRSRNGFHFRHNRKNFVKQRHKDNSFLTTCKIIRILGLPSACAFSLSFSSYWPWPAPVMK